MQTKFKVGQIVRIKFFAYQGELGRVVSISKNESWKTILVEVKGNRCLYMPKELESISKLEAVEYYLDGKH